LTGLFATAGPHFSRACPRAHGGPGTRLVSGVQQICGCQTAVCRR